MVKRNNIISFCLSLLLAFAIVGVPVFATESETVMEEESEQMSAEQEIDAAEGLLIETAISEPDLTADVETAETGKTTILPFVQDFGDLLHADTAAQLYAAAQALEQSRGIQVIVFTDSQAVSGTAGTLEQAREVLLDIGGSYDNAALIYVNPNLSPQIAVDLKGEARSVLSKYGTDNVYNVVEGTEEPLEGKDYYSAVLLRIQTDLIAQINEDSGLTDTVDQVPVYDQAGLLTPSEVEMLSGRATDLGLKYDISVVIVTTPSTDGRLAMQYADDFYDYNGYKEDGILLLISMDPREIYISTTGKVIQIITNANVEKVLDDMFNRNDISSGEYYGAANTFLDDVDRYMAAGPGGKIRELTMVEILVPVGLAILVALIMVSSVKKNYAKGRQAPNYNYRRMAKANYSRIDDHLTDKRLSSYVIPKSTGSSGGGGGGGGTRTGSSGRSHGGGGRRF